MVLSRHLTTPSQEAVMSLVVLQELPTCSQPLQIRQYNNNKNKNDNDNENNNNDISSDINKEWLLTALHHT